MQLLVAFWSVTSRTYVNGDDRRCVDLIYTVLLNNTAYLTCIHQNILGRQRFLTYVNGDDRRCDTFTSKTQELVT